MQYNQEIVQKMLADERYIGALTEKMARVWKTRDVIPNQYFNPKYVAFVKKNEFDKANQVKDPYFNEKFILKVDLTDDEKKLQLRIIQVLTSEKMNTNEVCRQVGISSLLFHDAQRADEKSVDMRSEHLLALKKNINELRNNIRKVIEPMNSKNGRFTERDVKQIDTLLEDKRLFIMPVIKSVELYRSRIYARQYKMAVYFEPSEIQHYIDCFALFLVETSI